MAFYLLHNYMDFIKCRGLDFIGTLGWTETYYEKIYKEIIEQYFPK